MDKYKYLKSKTDWSRLDDEVLRYIAHAFDNVSEKKIHEFVELSIHYRMVEENYLKLAEMEKDTSSLIYLIASTIHRKGTQLMEQFKELNDWDYFKAATSCYFMSILLNEHFLPGYISLACTFAIGGDAEKAIEYLNIAKDMHRDLINNPGRLKNHYEKAMLDTTDVAIIDRLIKDFEEAAKSTPDVS